MDLQQPDTIKMLLEYIKEHKDRLIYNENIFNILEGDLLKSITEALYEQLSPDSAAEAIQRSAPINVLKKLIDKLSGLYMEAPQRVTPSETDMDLISKYEVEDSINTYFQDSNEGFNSYKYTCIEMFHADSKVQFRVIPSHQFLPFSNDPVNPLKLTAIIKFAGEYVDPKTKKKHQRIHVYTDEQFVSFTDEGDIITDDMIENEGVNPYGVIPFSYIARSRYLLVPMPDSDTLRMTVLFPVLLTDLNFTMKYMSNPIIYTVDVDSEALNRSPNVFWNMKSDVDGKTPSVGIVKPDSDIEGMLSIIKEQMMTWFESKNVKAGAMGSVTTENAQSGIALMLRNMDTTNDMKKQTIFFQKFEQDFWSRLSIIHNTLARAGELEDRRLFSEDGISVRVKYSDMKPIEDRIERVRRLKLEVDSGFYSKRRAISDLQEGMDEVELEKLMQEIEDERVTIIEDENGEMAES